MNTKTYIKKSITITKPISFDTVDGKTTFAKGHELWSKKALAHNANNHWPVNEFGFNMAHFYCYNQGEYIPLENIELKTETWDEVTTIENKNSLTVDKGEFAFAKVANLN